MAVVIRVCNIEDAEVLQAISRETFAETFSEDNDPSHLESFLAEAYSLDKLKRELSNPETQFFFAEWEGEVAAYLKVNEGSAQSEEKGNKFLEVERIYVRQAFQKLGLGRVLMDKAVEIAKTSGKSSIWLGVWEKNEKAIAFYEKKGFVRTGAHSFFVGDDEQIDYIMEKTLLP